MELKIGVLLARSDMFPKLAIQFLNGLKLAFKNNADTFSPKLLIESIGNGTDEELLQRVEKMILQEDVDVLVSFCSFFMLDKLTTIANNYKKSVIHVSLGGRAFKSGHQSPYVVYQSLNVTQSCYMSGKIAAETIGKKGAVIASFYDGGYHMAEGFVSGFAEYGGEIIYNYVSQMDYREDDFRTMVEGIKATQPEVLFALFSYKEATRVMEVLTASGLDHIKVLALPLMVDESVAIQEVNPENIQSVASWAFEEASAEMIAFKDNFKSNYDEMPDLFGLLGNEVGTILTDAFRSEGRIPLQLGNYMASRTFSSPRGELQYTALNESIPKAFKVRQLFIRDGFCHNQVIGLIDSKPSEIINKKMEELPNSGWKNPYICT